MALTKITLKTVTEKIALPIAELDAGDNGLYVANNSMTIIQALFKKELKNIRAIYLGSGLEAEPIGLILVHTSRKKLKIGRFMIDKNYQGKGYGEEAFRIGVKFFIKKYKPEIIELDTRNTIAFKLYQKFGFVEYKREHSDKKGDKIFLRSNAKDFIKR